MSQDKRHPSKKRDHMAPKGTIPASKEILTSYLQVHDDLNDELLDEAERLKKEIESANFPSNELRALKRRLRINEANVDELTESRDRFQNGLLMVQKVEKDKTKFPEDLRKLVEEAEGLISEYSDQFEELKKERIAYDEEVGESEEEEDSVRPPTTGKRPATVVYSIVPQKSRKVQSDEDRSPVKKTPTSVRITASSVPTRSAPPTVQRKKAVEENDSDVEIINDKPATVRAKSVPRQDDEEPNANDERVNETAAGPDEDDDEPGFFLKQHEDSASDEHSQQEERSPDTVPIVAPAPAPAPATAPATDSVVVHPAPVIASSAPVVPIAAPSASPVSTSKPADAPDASVPAADTQAVTAPAIQAADVPASTAADPVVAVSTVAVSTVTASVQTAPDNADPPVVAAAVPSAVVPAATQASAVFKAMVYSATPNLSTSETILSLSVYSDPLGASLMPAKDLRRLYVLVALLEQFRNTFLPMHERQRTGRVMIRFIGDNPDLFLVTPNLLAETGALDDVVQLLS